MGRQAQDKVSIEEPQPGPRACSLPPSTPGEPCVRVRNPQRISKRNPANPPLPPPLISHIKMRGVISSPQHSFEALSHGSSGWNHQNSPLIEALLDIGFVFPLKSLPSSGLVWPNQH